jgi:hypothetical protein
MVELLPFVEQDKLYAKIDPKSAWDAAGHAEAVKTQLPVFRCPDWGREKSDAPAEWTAYLGAAGLGADAARLPATDPRAGVFGYDRRADLDRIEDGASNTLLLMESARDNGPWAQGGPGTVRGLDPGDRPYLGPGQQFGGTHFSEKGVFTRSKPIGCNAATCDGAVRFLNNDFAWPVLEALVTVAGGEDVPADW